MKQTKKRKTSRLVRTHAKKAGLPPGTVVYTGDQKVDTVRITVLDYDADQYREHQLGSIEEAFKYKATPTITWINIDGLHDVSLIENIGKHYDLHPLIQEDIVSTAQRPKLEEMEHYLYVVLRMLYSEHGTQTIHSEQISLVLGDNFVITFQESIGDVFDSVRDRIRHAKGRIRKLGTDYLVYALLDAR